MIISNILALFKTKVKVVKGFQEGEVVYLLGGLGRFKKAIFLKEHWNGGYEVLVLNEKGEMVTDIWQREYTYSEERYNRFKTLAEGNLEKVEKVEKK